MHHTSPGVERKITNSVTDQLVIVPVPSMEREGATLNNVFAITKSR